MEMQPAQVIDFLWDYLRANAATIESQQFFLILRQISHAGLGVGNGDAIATSGEGGAMTYAAQLLAKRYAAQKLNIVDVGANVGEFASLARLIFGVDGPRYFCFEPSRATFAKLSKNAEQWPDARLFNMALGDKQGEMQLFADKAGSGLASLYRRRLDHLGIDMALKETVHVSTLDRFAVDQELDRIHFLKLDVEGYELQCLQGAERLIRERRIDFIQFEFGGTNIDSRSYFQDFWYLLKDYELSRILRNGLLHIAAYSEIEEMFQTQNYLARLRA
jgi:FkbM family methyltransferase